MRKTNSAALTLLLAIVATQVSAEPIRLRAGSVEPVAKQQARHLLLDSPAPARSLFLVQFAGPVKDEWKSEVTGRGVTLLEYVPEHAFIARVGAGEAASLLDLECVKWVGRLPAYHRVDPALRASRHERVEVAIRTACPDDRPAVESRLRLYGAQIDAGAGSAGTFIRASIPAAALDAVSRIEDVLWVEEYRPPRFANSVAQQIVQAPDLRQRSGLFGAGQIVAFADSGLDTGAESTLSADFAGRLVSAYALRRPGDWSDLHGHGTHVMGVAVGSGVLSGSNPAARSYDGSFAGLAPEAQFIIQSIGGADEGISLPLNLAQLFQPPYTDGARIHSDSWGTMSAGAYTLHSQQVDEFVWNHSDLVLVFPSGNSGSDGNADGVTDFGSVWAPGTAKNCITVGGTESVRSTGRVTTYGAAWSSEFPANPIRDDYISDNASGMIAWSSRGPCADGRLKPDICAPGTNIVSNRSQAVVGQSRWWAIYDADYAYWGGTSMSTPMVAGAAALVREYYEREVGVEPSAALVKATLLNGATDIHPGQYTRPYPDEVPKRPNNIEGWGRLNVSSALDPPAPKVVEFVDETVGLSTGQSKQYTFRVLGNSVPLAVTLVWTDAPGSPLAGTQLVNNLNLKVIDPNQVLRRGNGTVDSINNVEGVDIARPLVGDYTVVVEAVNVPVGPQPFALVVSGELPGSYVAGQVLTTTGNPIPGVTVSVVGAGVSKTTATSATGVYSANVPPGEYTVTPSRAGWTFEPVQAQVEVGEEGLSGIDFTGAAPAGAVSGTVTRAVGGITNYAIESKHPYANRSDIVWTITGHPSATQIRVRFEAIEVEQDVDYVFVENADGTIYDSFTGDHSDVWSAWVPGNVLRVRLVSDESMVGNGFQISGYETDLILQGGLEGVKLDAGPGGNWALSGPDGTFTISDLEPVSYVVRPELDSYLFSPDLASAHVPVGGVVGGLDFLGFPPGAVSGCVKTGNIVETPHSVQSPHPYPNNAVLEYIVQGPANASRIRVHFLQIGVEPMADAVFVTDMEGNILDVYDEPYYEDVWSSWVPGNALKVVLVSDYSISDYGFSIDRYAALTDERGIEGITVTLAPGGLSATTGPGGYYTIDAVRAGRYDAQASGSYWGFEPDMSGLNCAPGLTTTGIDFFGTLQEMPSIAYAKSLPDGAEVLLGGGIVTAGTAQMSGFFYIEDPSRVSGIRVVTPQTVAEGSVVTVRGVMATQDGERQINASSVTVDSVSGDVPDPLAMTISALGGGPLNAHTPGVAFGKGTHNVGLLVKVCGTVADVGQGFFVLDDGSVVKPPTAEPFPVHARVICPPGVAAPAMGAVVVVTGISSVAEDDGQFVRAIRPRTASDILEIAPPP